MTTNVLLLHYNNYFNRQVKKLNTISEYKNADSDYSICNGVNFVPGDGAFTTLTLGFGNNPSNVFDHGANFDYLVVMNADTTAPDYDIVSRWFILEANRTRDGQYELSLKRDVIADCYESVVTAPTYIEKAYIDNTSNPLIFNNESLKVNQIKQSEYALQDETKCGWIVGYVPSTADWSPALVSKKVAITNTANVTVDNLNEWSYWKNCVTKNTSAQYMTDLSGARKVKFRIKNSYISSSGGSRPTYYSNLFTQTVSFNAKDNSDPTIVQKQSGQIKTTESVPSWYTDWVDLTYVSVFSGNNSFGASSMNTMLSPLRNNSTYLGYLNAYADTSYFETGSSSDVSTLRALEGTIIYETSTDTYYQVGITNNTRTYSKGILDGSNALNYFNNNITRQIIVNNVITGNITGNISSTSSVNRCECEFTDTGYGLTLTPVSVTLQVTMPSHNSRDHLKDAAYDMFCIPYSDTMTLSLEMDGVATSASCSKFAALAMATAICEALGSGYTYDLQLLPYCPNRALIGRSSTPAYNLSLYGSSYNVIRQHVGGQVADLAVNAVIWCTESVFDIEIGNPFDAKTFKPPYRWLSSNIQRDTYYLLQSMPNVPSQYSDSSYNYAGIRNTGGSVISMYKVNKLTGYAEYYDNWKKIAMWRDSQGVSKLTTSKGTFSSEYGSVTITQAEYNALPYYYMFVYHQDSMGTNNLNYFLEHWKVPRELDYNVDPESPIDMKVLNDCYLYRLVSGNYASAFEFSMAKSYGINGYKVECTYKPFSPYIHVMPELKGLYGDNFVAIDDARGLVCGGDYSLTQLNNAWATYQMNNKNYQEMFDRQIQNMDVNNEIAMQEAKWQAVAGVFTGAAGGAAAGGSTGNPYAAAAGAVAGAALGAVGGVMDVQNLAKRQNEARDYSIDMYNYNLQNIQAMPSTLAKISSLTYNTRVWPFLETYTCTDTEEQAYRSKLEYDGMTVNAIGQIQDYIKSEPHYLRGAIIRLPDLKEDSQVAHEIYNEILKGVYI